MRIITGSRRGRKLKTLPGDAVRPTPDRVKEALFNILQFDLEGRVFLDLFAGSGQIGLEALSRGAKRAVFVDSAKASCGVVLENIHTTGFENEAQVMNAEYASYLLRCTETFDIAFLDPPYRSESGRAALEIIGRRALLKENGVAVFEHAEPFAGEIAGLCKIDERKYGKAYLTFFGRSKV